MNRANDGNARTVEIAEEHILWILKVRRDRARVFGGDLFSDQPWDILFELLAAKMRGRTVILADLGHITASSTLVRWIAALRERGLVYSQPAIEPEHMQIALSDEGADRMMCFLTHSLQAAPTESQSRHLR